MSVVANQPKPRQRRRFSRDPVLNAAWNLLRAWRYHGKPVRRARDLAVPQRGWHRIGVWLDRNEQEYIDARDALIAAVEAELATRRGGR